MDPAWEYYEDPRLNELSETTAFPSEVSSSGKIWQEDKDPRRTFSKASFWLESLHFKAVNVDLGDLHINLSLQSGDQAAEPQLNQLLLLLSACRRASPGVHL